MKVALIGYGKMGQAIEKIAKERGHEIVSIIDLHNLEEFDSSSFRSADVAIEFTRPEVAVSNIRNCFKASVPVVCGTTGWTEHLPEIQKEVTEGGKTLFWTSNFSLGVNIFFALNKYLARLMNHFSGYEVEMTEIHHTQKLDAPSGTAITLADGIMENLDRKTGWEREASRSPDNLVIKSIREGQVPGIHTVRYESDVDSIEITHDAKSRYGFAFGAVIAAEFTAGKKGMLGMPDLLKI